MLSTSLISYFTYFLAIQKCNHNSNYTIHGLWIDFKRGGYPEFCNKTIFDVDKLKDLQKDLDHYWPSCYGNNQGLWEHEWKKHGTCFNPKFSFHAYFKKTLDLYKNKIKDVKACKKNECLIPIEFVELDD